MDKLLMKATGGAPAEIELREGANRIGRGPDNDLSIPDPSVSTFHCVVMVTSGTAVVKDLGSTNGTFIEGQPIQEAALRHGQILRLGQVELSYRKSAPANFKVTILSASAPGAAAEQPPGPRLATRSAATPLEAPVAGPPPVPPPVAPSVLNPCKYHPTVPAELICKECGSRYCLQCADEQKVGSRVWRRCPVCKGRCVSLEEQLAEHEAKLAKEQRTFYQELPGVFKYPFGKGGILLLVLGMIVYLVLDFLSNFSLLITILAGGYLFAYMQKIIISSAQGDEVLPDWPDFSEWWSDIVRPFLLLMFTCGICFAPALGYMIWSSGSEDDLNVMILFPLIGLGFLYFPMALLAAAMSDSFLAVNPLVVVPAILKMPLAYLIACIVFFVIVAVRYFSATVLAALTPIPFLDAIPAGFLALYFLTVEMRLLGVMYYKHRAQIGWYHSR